MEQMHFLVEAQSGSKSNSNVQIKADQNLTSKMETDGNMKQTSPQFLQRIQTDRNSVDHNEGIVLENIHRLKDVQLESQLKILVGRERQLLHFILKHIQEADRRKLYAARAFSTLFEYLTKEMGYSSGAAQRRIEAARLMNQVPELALKIQQGDVNLSQIGIISQAVKLKESQMGKKLSAEVKREVIAEVAKKTTAQTQVLVAEKLDLPLQQPERKMMQKDQSCVLSITLTPAQQMKLQRCRELLAAKLQQGNKAFTTVNYLEELMDFYLSKKDPRLQKCKNQDTHQGLEKTDGLHLPKESKNIESFKNCSINANFKNCSINENFEVLKSEGMNQGMNHAKLPDSSVKDDFVSNMEKLEVPSISKMENGTDPMISEMENLELNSAANFETVPFNSVSRMEFGDKKSTFETESTIKKTSRRQTSLKKQVFQKWDCCQFQDPLTGRKCGEKFQLEIEHLQPRWAGGPDHLENRTLLCRTHNQWKYRQQSGLRTVWNQR